VKIVHIVYVVHILHSVHTVHAELHARGRAVVLPGSAVLWLIFSLWVLGIVAAEMVRALCWLTRVFVLCWPTR
jgi:hypothetical protein